MTCLGYNATSEGHLELDERGSALFLMLGFCYSDRGREMQRIIVKIIAKN